MGKKKILQLVRSSTPKGTRNGAEPSRSEQLAPEFLVAGVGASAGGLAAFIRILAPIPADAELAIVLVQHLSRDHRSLLTELLGAKTALSVVEGQDGVEIKRGVVYVIRPDTQLTVADGHLRVGQRPKERAGDAPIDRLFESLADQYGERAIGVVLSGSGHDGAAGVRRIKAAGGIVMVQDPAEADSNEMPRAALGAGDVADVVLGAAELATELLRLSENPFFRRANAPEETGEAAPTPELISLFQLVRRTMGVDFTHYKPATLMRRIRRRMAIHRTENVASYLKVLQRDHSEIERLHDDILIHVTSFFRDPESFASLSEHVVPALLQSHENDGLPVRVWIPGCSSGEEAYSVAIVLLEALRDHPGVGLQVFGTDVSHKMVARARAGIYPASAVAELDPERIRQFFVRHGADYRVSQAVRECCVFARQDLTRDPPFSKLDLVVCRNLLIYLGPPLQRRAIEILHYALRPSGFLLLGRSETTGAQPGLFELIDPKWKTYRRKSTEALTRGIEFAVRVPDVAAAGVLLSRQPKSPPVADIQAEANRIVLERYAPASMLVDDSWRLLRSSGGIARFLELPKGDATLDAIKLTRQGLSAPLRSALLEARRSGAVVRREGLHVVSEGLEQRVQLEINPLGAPANRHYLIFFEDATATAALRAGKSKAKKTRPKSPPPELQLLEEELNSTRQDLQAMIQDLEAANEELQSANEEILSSNEELQSTNEELDTAREELQSTNEELSTVNDELQSRNTQLTELNGDLMNLLANIQIPIVIVNADLKIRRVTPAAERMLNLIPSDVGRPIGHIKPNIRCPDLEGMIRNVLETVSVRECEVSDAEGNTFLLRIRPYRSVDNRIDGAVLALFDLSSTLKLARETGQAIMARLPDPALLIDVRYMVHGANPAFYARFGGSPADTDGHLLFDVRPGLWTPGVRALLEQELPIRKAIDGHRMHVELEPLKDKVFLLDARYFEQDGVAMTLIVLREEPMTA